MKAIIFRLFLLATTVAITAGLTYAYFSSQATSSGNIITTGSLKLGGALNAKWSASGLLPGDSLEGNYPLDNTGSANAEHLEIATTNSGGAGDLQEVLTVEKMLYGYDSDNDGDVSDEIEGNVVDIIAVIVSGTSSLDGSGAVSSSQDPDYTLSLETAVDSSNDVAQLDSNNDNKLTLKELAAGVIEIRKASRDDGLRANSNAAFYAKITLPEDVGDTYQEKSNTLTWTYTLNQTAGQ